VHVADEIVVDEGDESDSDSDEEDLAVIEEADAVDANIEDDGRIAHDKAVMKTLRGQAIKLMADKGITIMPADNKMALQLFPRVSDLMLGNHQLISP
jgi:hypothetical protein